MKVLYIIAIFTLAIQSSFAKSTIWQIKLKNNTIKQLPISKVDQVGYHVSLPQTGETSRQLVLPHKAVIEAKPTQSITVDLELSNNQGNQAELLKFQDSTLFLAGEVEGNQWRTIELKLVQISTISHEGRLLAFDSLQFWSPDSQLPWQKAPSKQASIQVSTKIPKPPKLTKIKLDSETPGAIVYMNGLPTLVTTPYAFEGLEPGKYDFEMRWQVNDNLWAVNDSTVIRDQTQKNFYLKSQRVRPELTIQTIPSNASVRFEGVEQSDYEDKWITPLQLKDIRPGIRKLLVSKEGFKDTSLVVNVMAAEPELVVLNLTPDMSVENSLKYSKLRQKKWGVAFMWASFPTAVLGITYHALAEKRLLNAWATQKQLRLMGVHTEDSPNYSATKAENQEAVHEANSFYQSSRILLGIATILGTTGVVLYF